MSPVAARLRTLTVAGLCATSLPGTVAAQTAIEAAAANVQLGIALCLQNARDGAGAIEALKTAGFTYAIEDFGGGPDDKIHWFAAPANSANIAVIAQPGAVECRVGTDAFGVTQAVPFAQAVLDQLHPGVFQPGNMENTTAIVPGGPNPNYDTCTGSVGWFGQRPVVVEVATLGNDPGCAEDGTSQIILKM